MEPKYFVFWRWLYTPCWSSDVRWARIFRELASWCFFFLIDGGGKFLQMSTRRIQTLPDRIGLMVETSHPQVIGLVRGNPGFLGHTWILRVLGAQKAPPISRCTQTYYISVESWQNYSDLRGGESPLVLLESGIWECHPQMPLMCPDWKNICLKKENMDLIFPRWVPT